jgi:hypothetical protein
LCYFGSTGLFPAHTAARCRLSKSQRSVAGS